MPKITFYNQYHNGDLFTSKQYIRELMTLCPEVSFDYWHYNSAKTLQDLSIPVTDIPDQVQEYQKFHVTDDHLFVNTWVGAYQANRAGPPTFFTDGINLLMLHKIWNYIYQQISNWLGREIQVNPDPAHYIPVINYSSFDVSNIDQFWQNNPKPGILFSNGAAMSGQSFQERLGEMVTQLADELPAYNFICTARFPSNRSNIIFTEDIISPTDPQPGRGYWNDGLPSCDLNEISYLSRKCSVIVGKNSGPFIYCLTQENLADTSKTFISFNIQPTDNLTYGINTRCRYIQHRNFFLPEMFQLVRTIICQ